MTCANHYTITQGKLKELCLSVQENGFILSSVMTQIGGKCALKMVLLVLFLHVNMEAVDKETVKQIL